MRSSRARRKAKTSSYHRHGNNISEILLFSRDMTRAAKNAVWSVPVIHATCSTIYGFVLTTVEYGNPRYGSKTPTFMVRMKWPKTKAIVYESGGLLYMRKTRCVNFHLQSTTWIRTVIILIISKMIATFQMCLGGSIACCQLRVVSWIVNCFNDIYPTRPCCFFVFVRSCRCLFVVFRLTTHETSSAWLRSW